MNMFKLNGNLLISYQVTQEIEIEELIKKWFPYVKVVEPLSLKEKIEGVFIIVPYTPYYYHELPF